MFGAPYLLGKLLLLGLNRPMLHYFDMVKISQQPSSITGSSARASPEQPKTNSVRSVSRIIDSVKTLEGGGFVVIDYFQRKQFQTLIRFSCLTKWDL
jgi:hypothetical protein